MSTNIYYVATSAIFETSDKYKERMEIMSHSIRAESEDDAKDIAVKRMERYLEGCDRCKRNKGCIAIVTHWEPVIPRIPKVLLKT